MQLQHCISNFFSLTNFDVLRSLSDVAALTAKYCRLHSGEMHFDSFSCENVITSLFSVLQMV
jgi:hypothetical protein